MTRPPRQVDIARAIKTVEACGLTVSHAYETGDGGYMIEVDQSAPRRPSDFIYFVRCGGYVKIGYSTNVKARVASLATANPLPLVVLREEPGTMEAERAYHERFAAYRALNEWFRLEGDLAEFLDIET